MNKQFISDRDDAIQQALKQAVEKKKSVKVIETHGYGHQIFSNEFQTDRQYYHGEGGKKMFFTYIAEAFPGGLVNYHE